MLDQVAALGDQMDRKNGILIGESLSEESKRRRDDVIDTGAFGMQASGSDVVFFNMSSRRSAGQYGNLNRSTSRSRCVWISSNL